MLSLYRAIALSLTLAASVLIYSAPAGLAQSSAGGSGGGGGGGSSGPYYGGQYNATLPTFASGQAGYLTLDASGRMILSPSSAVSVSNLPATQAVSNAGSFAVQNTASIPAGSNSIGTIGNLFALDATVTARLGTLGQKASSGSAPVVLASDQSPVSISTTRATTYSEAAFSAIAVSGTLYGTTRPTVTSASRFNVWAGCSAAGASLLLLGSNDAFASTSVVIGTSSVAAASAAASGETAVAGTTISAPVMFTSYRGRVTNGSNANNCSLVSSFTAN